MQRPGALSVKRQRDLSHEYPAGWSLEPPPLAGTTPARVATDVSIGHNLIDIVSGALSGRQTCFDGWTNSARHRCRGDSDERENSSIRTWRVGGGHTSSPPERVAASGAA